MLLNILFILIGFVLLMKGGDFLIDGAVAIAQRAKLSNMVIGLTVVGFGTSMPELLVSTQAAWVGSSGLAIGNVAGSNIANIALILGVTSLIHPLPSTRNMMRIDIPFMLFAIVLFIVFAYTGDEIQRWQGICMVLLLIGFISWEVCPLPIFFFFFCECWDHDVPLQILIHVSWHPYYDSDINFS